MASRKTDIEVQDLARDEALAGQLRTGQPVSIVQRDSAELQVLSAEGSLIGVLADLPSKQHLLAGSAVIRSLRKQQDLLVHVLLRVTHPEPNAAPQKGEILLGPYFLSMQIFTRLSRHSCTGRAPLNPAYLLPLQWGTLACQKIRAALGQFLDSVFALIAMVAREGMAAMSCTERGAFSEQVLTPMKPSCSPSQGP